MLLQLQHFKRRLGKETVPHKRSVRWNARAEARGTIYRPVSNISSRSAHSGADLVRTKSLRATIKYPRKQPCRLRFTVDPIGGPAFHDFVHGRRRPRDRSAEIDEISPIFLPGGEDLRCSNYLSHLSRSSRSCKLML